MNKFTISINDIIYNNFFLATICSLLAILLLFIDHSIFIKKIIILLILNYFY